MVEHSASSCSGSLLDSDAYGTMAVIRQESIGLTESCIVGFIVPGRYEFRFDSAIVNKITGANRKAQEWKVWAESLMYH